MGSQAILVTGRDSSNPPPLSGARGVNLRHLFLHGFAVPATILVPPAAYAEFVRSG